MQIKLFECRGCRRDETRNKVEVPADAKPIKMSNQIDFYWLSWRSDSSWVCHSRPPVLGASSATGRAGPFGDAADIIARVGRCVTRVTSANQVGRSDNNNKKSAFKFTVNSGDVHLACEFFFSTFWTFCICKSNFIMKFAGPLGSRRSF